MCKLPLEMTITRSECIEGAVPVLYFNNNCNVSDLPMSVQIFIQLRFF